MLQTIKSALFTVYTVVELEYLSYHQTKTLGIYTRYS